MPSIPKITFATIAFFVMIITAISSSQAQVSWTVPQIIPRDGTQIVCLCPDVYISLSDLKTMLEQAGISVEELMSQPETTITTLESPTWDVQLPVRTLKVSLVQAGQSYSFVLQALAEQSSLNKSEKLAKTPEEAEFIPFDYMLNQFKTTKLPLRFEGWQRPKIQLGTFSFILQRQGAILYSESIYYKMFYNWWQFGEGRPGTRNQLIFGSTTAIITRVVTSPESGTKTVQISKQQSGPALDGNGRRYTKFRHAIRTKDPANTVYAIVSGSGGFQVQAGQPVPPTFFTIARTDAQGILQFTLPFRILEFTQNSRLIKDEQKDAGTEKNPAPSLLYKLTGRLDSQSAPVELIRPNKTKIAALN